MNTNTLITGHEADIAATEKSQPQGEFVTIKIRLVGSSAALAHPLLKPGKQADGSTVLLAETFRRWSETRNQVTARVLITTFCARMPNWVEKRSDSHPEWRVDEWDCRHRPGGFGPGAICDYWDGRGNA